MPAVLSYNSGFIRLDLFTGGITWARYSDINIITPRGDGTCTISLTGSDIYYHIKHTAEAVMHTIDVLKTAENVHASEASLYGKIFGGSPKW